MAVLIPDTPRDCSWGERQVFERFERDLRDRPQWVVLHSLGLVEHQQKIWGEADFVVLSTKGIFVLEVKGGRVTCQNGRWMYGQGETAYSRSESPWSQASSAMFALRRRIEQLDPRLAGLLMGFGVMMPHETFLATGPEIEQETLLDRRGFGRNFGFYLGQLQRYWDAVYQERHGRTLPLPTDEDLRRLRVLLRPDIESSISLGSELNGLNRELIQLTNRQIRVSRRMAANPRSIVSGRAGTGKTILAIERAKQLAAEGHSVLYLCFNKLLARHVRENLAAEGLQDRIRVRHIHSLFREVIVAAGLQGALESANVTEAELFGRLFPQTFVDAALLTNVQTADALVVDEAQDVLTPDNLDALDILVRGGLRLGRWHLFLDPMQNIYQVDSEIVEQRLSESSVVHDDLFENCRNTREVAQQASIISGIDMAIEGAIEGVACECRFYADGANAIAVLDREVKRLIQGGVNPSDMIVLSTRRRENSLVAEVKTIGGVPLTDITETEDGRSIPFSTMHAFKGLERNVVIAIDLESLGDPLVAMLHYAGLSRARTLLIPLLSIVAKERYNEQAVAFGRRLAVGGTRQELNVEDSN